MASCLSSLFELPFCEVSGGVTPESFLDPAQTINDTSEPCYAEELEMPSNFLEFRPNEPNSSIAHFQPWAFDDAAPDAALAYVSRHPCLDKRQRYPRESDNLHSPY